MKEISLKGLNETIYYEKLKCGLEIYIWQNKKVNTFYGTLSVKYGSIYNEFKVNNKVYNTPPGVAHFLEHVKFNEKKGVTAHDYFNKMGSDTNAFTTFNYTNYQVFGSAKAKENINYLVDFVLNDYFTKNIIKNEKGIIISEANMGKDDPYTVMLFDHLNNIFHNYEHKKLITGAPEEIRSITIDDIRLAFNSFYHPANMFLIVTGNVNPYEIVASLKDNFAKRKIIEYKKPERIIKKENKTVRVKYEEKNINVTNKKIKIGVKIPKKELNAYDLLHIKIYLSILLKANFGDTSDFKDDLIKKELVSNISFFSEVLDDYILIMFTIDSDYQEEVLKMFNNKLDNLSIDKKTFIRMKKSSIATIILEFEDVEFVNSVLQQEILNYGGIIDNIKEIYENISYEDILIIKEILNTKERSILVLNPLE